MAQVLHFLFINFVRYLPDEQILVTIVIYNYYAYYPRTFVS